MHEGEFVRRTALPVIAALSMALLLPQNATGITPAAPQAAGAEIVDPPAATGDFQEVGPGVYSTDSKTFEIAENDAGVGAIGRRHSVTAQADGVARPQSAPASRPDMGVFGPGWEAEFLGGELNQKLEQQGDAIVVTDLNVGESVRYLLKSSLDFPDGGGVKKYETAEGDKITDTTRWDSATGTLVSTMVETLNVNLSVADEGQPDGGTEVGDEPVAAASLLPTRTWKQAAPGVNAWRVTSAGNAAYGVSTVSYDSKGRISTITEPAVGEALKETVAISYASTTTASGTALGDYAGRAKEVKVTTGATTQTVARYTYDASGLLRSVTNPVQSSAAVASYVYDSTGRVSDIVSPDHGDWDLTYPAASASPDVLPTGPPARPRTRRSRARPGSPTRTPSLRRPRTSARVRSPTRRPTRASAAGPVTGSTTGRPAAPPGPRTTAGTSPTSSTPRPATASWASTTTAAAPPARTSASRAAGTSVPRATCTTTATA